MCWFLTFQIFIIIFGTDTEQTGVWSNWALRNQSSCSVSCGSHGMKWRWDERICDNDSDTRNCEGKHSRQYTLNCKAEPCPGGWSEWTLAEKSECSVTCGNGEQQVIHRRNCENLPTEHGRKPCVGIFIKQFTAKCSPSFVCYKWSEWTWVRSGMCDAECLQHVHYARSCLLPRCYPDERMDVKNCTGGLCDPVHGGWTTWSVKDKGRCPADCQITVVKERFCTNPIPEKGGYTCLGDNILTIKEECRNGSCQKVDGGWSGSTVIYSGQCSVTCGYGKKEVHLTRLCNKPEPKNGGLDCVGNVTVVETRECQSKNRCDSQLDGHWGEWTLNTSCSKTCGQGYKQTVKTRLCNNPAPLNAGRTCVGESRLLLSSVTPCNLVNCPAYGYWSAWVRPTVGKCLSHCKQLVSFRRTCINPPPPASAVKCHGNATDQYYQTCTGDECVSVDGQWSPWEMYRRGSCSSDCWTYIHFARACEDPPPFGGGRLCVGLSTDTRLSNCTGELCIGNNKTDHAFESDAETSGTTDLKLGIILGSFLGAIAFLTGYLLCR